MSSNTLLIHYAMLGGASDTHINKNECALVHVSTGFVDKVLDKLTFLADDGTRLKVGGLPELLLFILRRMSLPNFFQTHKCQPTFMLFRLLLQEGFTKYISLKCYLTWFRLAVCFSVN